MTYHQRVGESQDDGTQLSDDDRNTDGKQFPVVMFIMACNWCRMSLHYLVVYFIINDIIIWYDDFSFVFESAKLQLFYEKSK